MLFQDCICFALGRASRTVGKIYRERLAEFGLTQTQFFLLIALFEEDGIQITPLADKVALDKSTLTGLLDRLERDGLIERAAAPGDRRALQIRLTEKAQALREPLTTIYDETNSYFLSQLTDDERIGFDRAIGKLELLGGVESLRAAP